MPTPLSLHPTPNPQIFFAKGDLFGEDSLSRFDGIIAFGHSRPSFLRLEASAAIRDGKLTCPYKIYGLRYDKCPKLDAIRHFVTSAMRELSAKGCRNIGFHGARPSDGTYVQGAELCVKTVARWLESHPGLIDTVTFVDKNDDYFNLFGPLCRPTFL